MQRSALMLMFRNIETRIHLIQLQQMHPLYTFSLMVILNVLCNYYYCSLTLIHRPTAIVGVTASLEQTTVRRLVQIASSVCSLRSLPFFRLSNSVASCVISTAASTISLLASISAAACCRTNIVWAISGAYDKSTRSKDIIFAPVTSTRVWSVWTSFSVICWPSVCSEGQPSGASYGNWDVICLRTACACNWRKVLFTTCVCQLASGHGFWTSIRALRAEVATKVTTALTMTGLPRLSTTLRFFISIVLVAVLIKRNSLPNGERK